MLLLILLYYVLPRVGAVALLQGPLSPAIIGGRRVEGGFARCNLANASKESNYSQCVVCWSTGCDSHVPVIRAYQYLVKYKNVQQYFRHTVYYILRIRRICADQTFGVVVIILAVYRTYRTVVCRNRRTNGRVRIDPTMQLIIYWSIY